MPCTPHWMGAASAETCNANFTTGMRHQLRGGGVLRRSRIVPFSVESR